MASNQYRQLTPKFELTFVQYAGTDPSWDITCINERGNLRFKIASFNDGKIKIFPKGKSGWFALAIDAFSISHLPEISEITNPINLIDGHPS